MSQNISIHAELAPEATDLLNEVLIQIGRFLEATGAPEIDLDETEEELEDVFPEVERAEMSEAQYDVLIASIEDVRRRVTNLEKNQNRMEKRFDEFKQETQDLAGRFGREVGNLEKAHQELTQLQVGTDERIDRCFAEIRDLEQTKNSQKGS